MSIPEPQTKWPADQSLQPLDMFGDSVDVITGSHTSLLEVQATVHIPHGTGTCMCICQSLTWNVVNVLTLVLVSFMSTWHKLELSERRKSQLRKCL